MAEKTEAPKPAKEKKDKPAEPKKAEAAAAPEKPEGGEAARSKKINKMTLDEVQAKLEDIRSKQGGLRSRYARQLLQKRDLLKG
jgi:hypothetical protein